MGSPRTHGVYGGMLNGKGLQNIDNKEHQRLARREEEANGIKMQEKYIDKLEKRVKQLEEKVEKYDELEEKIRSLCEYITYKETIDDGDERTAGRRWRDQMGHDNSRDWDVPMEEPGSPKYNELSQTRSGYRKEIWKKVMEEKGWNI